MIQVILIIMIVAKKNKKNNIKTNSNFKNSYVNHVKNRSVIIFDK